METESVDVSHNRVHAINTIEINFIHSNGGEWNMDSEPVDLAYDGVKLGNATEQNEKSLTEIRKDDMIKR